MNDDERGFRIIERMNQIHEEIERAFVQLESFIEDDTRAPEVLDDIYMMIDEMRTLTTNLNEITGRKRHGASM